MNLFTRKDTPLAGNYLTCWSWRLVIKTAILLPTKRAPMQWQYSSFQKALAGGKLMASPFGNERHSIHWLHNRIINHKRRALLQLNETPVNFLISRVNINNPHCSYGMRLYNLFMEGNTNLIVIKRVFFTMITNGISNLLSFHWNHINPRNHGQPVVRRYFKYKNGKFWLRRPLKVEG